MNLITKLLIILTLVASSCFADLRIVEPEDRIGIIIACPNCYEDSITRYYEGKILIKEECNNCNYTTEYDKNKEKQNESRTE